MDVEFLMYSVYIQNHCHQLHSRKYDIIWTGLVTAWGWSISFWSHLSGPKFSAGCGIFSRAAEFSFFSWNFNFFLEFCRSWEVSGDYYNLWLDDV